MRPCIDRKSQNWQLHWLVHPPTVITKYWFPMGVTSLGFVFKKIRLGKAHFKKNAHIWAGVPTGGGGVWPNPNLLNRFCQVTEINCKNSKTKCPLQNNSIIGTTYDFSMKSVMCYLEQNETVYIQNMLRVSQVGGGGGGPLIDDGMPKYGCLF